MINETINLEDPSWEEMTLTNDSIFKFSHSFVYFSGTKINIFYLSTKFLRKKLVLFIKTTYICSVPNC